MAKVGSHHPGLFPEGESPSPAAGRIRQLHELQPGELADCFVLLAAREAGTTRDGKPYYRVQFRDARRSATAMIWSDSAWFAECDQSWKPGRFYKLRCRYSETQYGPQIEIDRIRAVTEDDFSAGFDPADFFTASRFNVEEMFTELLQLAGKHIPEEPVRQLVLKVLTDYSEDIQRLPAATRNHHAFVGGYLEHVLSVTQTAVALADKYRLLYPELNPPLSQSLVVAGAILHDIGKVRELQLRPQGAEYTAEGRLVGHILLGRDIVREAAAEIPDFPAEMLLRLEHIIISHQNLPEWGSPVSPHTPEALLVHYADDIDAKFQMMAAALMEAGEDDEAEFTSRHNPLRRAIFRGLKEEEPAE